MNKSVMLKFARRDKRMNQQQVADTVGLTVNRLSRLELDHKEWEHVDNETRAKFNELFKGAKGWEPLEMVNDNVEPVNGTENIVEEKVENVKPVVKHKSKNKTNDNELTEDDRKILTLVEFAYEGLNKSETHDDFTSNINLLNRILNKYGF